MAIVEDGPGTRVVRTTSTSTAKVSGSTVKVSGDRADRTRGGGGAAPVTPQPFIGATMLATGGVEVQAFVQLYNQTVETAVSSVVFPISSKYSQFLFTATGRCTKVALTETVGVRFNADTGSNYLWQAINAVATTASATENTSATSGFFTDWPGASSPAGTVGALFFYCPSIQSPFYKAIIGFGGAQSNTTASRFHATFSTWKSTSSITEITVFAASSNFDTGTKMSVYGVI